MYLIPIKRKYFKHKCYVCGANVERSFKNMKKVICFDCKKKRKANTTRLSSGRRLDKSTA